MPYAVEQEHFGAASFRVRGKIFAQLSADGRTGLVKLTRDVQERMLCCHPELCQSEPHWGRYGWTRVAWMALPSGVVEDLLTASWRTVTPRKLHALLEGRVC